MLPFLHGATTYGSNPGLWSALNPDFAEQKRHLMVPCGYNFSFAAQPPAAAFQARHREPGAGGPDQAFRRGVPRASPGAEGRDRAGATRRSVPRASPGSGDWGRARPFQERHREPAPGGPDRAFRRGVPSASTGSGDRGRAGATRQRVPRASPEAGARGAGPGPPAGGAFQECHQDRGPGPGQATGRRKNFWVTLLERPTDVAQ